MAKWKDTKITEADIKEFLAKEHNDFQLEITCLRELESRGFKVAHGGTYEDPITKKSRQFDLRASCTHRLNDDTISKVRLAVECKFLSEAFPLLVSRLPRTKDESYHEVVWSSERSKYDLIGSSSGTRIRIPAPASPYKIGEPVGKSTTQIGKTSNNELMSGDGEVFDKWSQAVSSAHDLVDFSTYDFKTEGRSHCIATIIPILVISDETLWTVSYSADGRLLTDLQQSNECDIFLGKHYRTGPGGIGIRYTISHLKVLTRSGFVDFLDRLTVDGDYRKQLFHLETMIRIMSGEDDNM